MYDYMQLPSHGCMYDYLPLPVAQCPSETMARGDFNRDLVPARKSAYSVACCKQPNPITRATICFLPDIIQEIKQLRVRHSQLTTRRRRLSELALPKQPRAVPFREQCICPEVANRKVQIVHLEERPVRTRTEQLAFPRVRSLSSLKLDASYDNFDASRKWSVNSLMRKSLCSMYSRLSNVQPQDIRQPKKKWDKKKWHEHLQRIKALAQPKSSQFSFVDRQSQRKSGGKSASSAASDYSEKSSVNYRRLNKLARPKTGREQPPFEWQLTPSVRNFVPSPRLVAMAKARPDLSVENQRLDPYAISQDALTYRASRRIHVLATPVKVYERPNPMARLEPFLIKPNALRAKASERIVRLAAPKDYMDTHTRARPYAVPRRALRAKLTPRLRELAKPKER